MRFSAPVIRKKKYLVLAIAKKSLKMQCMFSLMLNKSDNVKKGVYSDIRLLKNKLLPRDLTKESDSSAVTDCDIPRLFPEM